MRENHLPIHHCVLVLEVVTRLEIKLDCPLQFESLDASLREEPVVAFADDGQVFEEELRLRLRVWCVHRLLLQVLAFFTRAQVDRKHDLGEFERLLLCKARWARFLTRQRVQALPTVLEHVEHLRVPQHHRFSLTQIFFRETDLFEDCLGDCFVNGILKGELLAHLCLVLVPLLSLEVDAPLDLDLLSFLMLAPLRDYTNQVLQLDEVLLLKTVLGLGQLGSEEAFSLQELTQGQLTISSQLLLCFFHFRP